MALPAAAGRVPARVLRFSKEAGGVSNAPVSKTPAPKSGSPLHVDAFPTVPYPNCVAGEQPAPTKAKEDQHDRHCCKRPYCFTSSDGCLLVSASQQTVTGRLGAASVLSRDVKVAAFLFDKET